MKLVLGQPPSKSLSWDLGGEIGYSPGRFSVGIEIGRILKNFEVKEPFNYLGPSIGYRTFSLSASAVLLNLHFRLLGTSIDFFISRKLALFLEARYRFVKFKGMDGKGWRMIGDVPIVFSEINYEGDLNFDDGKGTGITDFYLGSFGHTGDEEDLRKAELNLDGIALSLGIKLYF